jgi:hypothetical protein
MNVFEKRFASAALILSLASGGALLAQDDSQQSGGEGAIPPVVVVPVVPDTGNGLSRNGSPRDWRGDIEADREAKGWGTSRPRTMNESRQNWIREYQDDAYRGGDQRWDRFRDPQDRSDRIGQNRSSFTPRRPDARSDAETQAQAYAAMYWMMKAQAEREEAQNER